MTINTHNVICEFGKHKGELYTRLPVNYLKWMMNNDTRDADIAKAELERRGTVTPDMDISGHAIDRASLHCMDLYRKSCKDDEGINAWLIRMATEAIKKKPNDKNHHIHNSIKFCFEKEGVWPVLKTVIRCTTRESQ